MKKGLVVCVAVLVMPLTLSGCVAAALAGAGAVGGYQFKKNYNVDVKVQKKSTANSTTS